MSAGTRSLVTSVLQGPVPGVGICECECVEGGVACFAAEYFGRVWTRVDVGRSGQVCLNGRSLVLICFLFLACVSRMLLMEGKPPVHFSPPLGRGTAKPRERVQVPWSVIHQPQQQSSDFRPRRHPFSVSCSAPGLRVDSGSGGI